MFSQWDIKDLKCLSVDTPPATRSANRDLLL